MYSFEQVYQAALNQNSRFIRKLDVDYLSEKLQPIDSIKPHSFFWTAAAEHAFQGNHKAVKLLFKHRARADHIARGYAKAGNHEMVELYRKQGASKDWIACGYAEGGFHDKVKDYRKRFNANGAIIACGYALGGYHEKVEEFRKLYPDSIGFIARTYALKGEHEKVQFYLNQGTIAFILRGYVEGGHYSIIADYLHKSPELKETVNRLYQEILVPHLKSYIENGYHSIIASYLRKFPSLKETIDKLYQEIDDKKSSSGIKNLFLMESLSKKGYDRDQILVRMDKHRFSELYLLIALKQLAGNGLNQDILLNILTFLLPLDARQAHDMHILLNRELLLNGLSRSQSLNAYATFFKELKNTQNPEKIQKLLQQESKDEEGLISKYRNRML